MLFLTREFPFFCIYNWGFFFFSSNHFCFLFSGYNAVLIAYFWRCFHKINTRCIKTLYKSQIDIEKCVILRYSFYLKVSVLLLWGFFIFDYILIILFWECMYMQNENSSIYVIIHIFFTNSFLECAIVSK